MQKSKCYIFAAEEDFGIAPVEAQACGIPVIAFGRGGVLETIIGKYTDEFEIEKSNTGMFFRKQTIQDIIDSVKKFESVQDSFDPEIIRNQALKFNTDRFESEFKTKINQIINNTILNK